MSRITAEAGHMCRGSALLERLLFLLPTDTPWAQAFFISHHDGCKDPLKAFFTLSRILVLKHKPIDYRSHAYLPAQSIPWRQDKFPSLQSRVFHIWPIAFFPPVTPRYSKKQPQSHVMPSLAHFPRLCFPPSASTISANLFRLLQ